MLDKPGKVSMCLVSLGRLDGMKTVPNNLETEIAEKMS